MNQFADFENRKSQIANQPMVACQARFDRPQFPLELNGGNR
jgi:hypothetical protein